MINARLLEIFFEGRFMCRIATDPDPTIEARGVSGYTMALARERPLDQLIRLQEDEASHALRDPASEMKIRVGVRVARVLFDGKPFAPAEEALRGADVSLEGQTSLLPGPSFQSRNNIVGSDDTLAMVVDPFELVIRRHEEDWRKKRESPVLLRAVDPLDPQAPEKEIWQFDRPNAYEQRFPLPVVGNDQEAKEAVGALDPYGYFRDRRRYLERRIKQGEEALKAVEAGSGSGRPPKDIQADIESARSRLHQIDFWGERIYGKLGFKLSWQHGIRGSREVYCNLGGRVDREGPWAVRYWFGGWDGDLLVGYMRGQLSFPFLPDRT